MRKVIRIPNEIKATDPVQRIWILSGSDEIRIRTYLKKARIPDENPNFSGVGCHINTSFYKN